MYEQVASRKLLSQDEFQQMREEVLRSTYKEIQDNIFTKYGFNGFESKILPSYLSYSTSGANKTEIDKLQALDYLYKHINSSYNNLTINIRNAIRDSHITCGDHNGYLFAKTNSLRLSFILWLAFWDRIQHFIETTKEPNLCSRPEIRNIIDKYSNQEHKKASTKVLDLTKFVGAPMFGKQKQKMTFRDFANSLKHDDDLLTNIAYEFITKSTIKKRTQIFTDEKGIEWKGSFSGEITTNMDDFNKIYYEICLSNLIEATDDSVDGIGVILNYLKTESKLKQYFN